MPYPFPELEEAQIQAHRRALAAQPQAAPQPTNSIPLPPKALSRPDELPPELKAALDADIQQAPKTFMDSVRDLGSAMASGIKDPSQWPEAVLQGLKGGASGATMGLSEFIPGMQPDPESWAASAGSLGGNIAGFMAGGAALRAAGGAVKGLQALRNPLVAEMVAGGAQAGGEALIRPQARGQETPSVSDVTKHALVGAALPPATRAVGKALGAAGRKLGILPEKPPLPPEAAPVAEEAMEQGSVMGVKGSRFSPEVEGQLRKFLSEPVENINVASGAASLPSLPEKIKPLDLVQHVSGVEGVVIRPATFGQWWIRAGEGNKLQLAQESQLRKIRPRWQSLADDIEPLGGRPAPVEPPAASTTPAQASTIEKPPMPPTAGDPSAGGPPATTPTPPGAPIEGAGPKPLLEFTRDTLKTMMNRLNLPIRVFRNDPAGRSIVQKMFDTADFQQRIERDMATSFKKAIGSLTSAEQEILKNARLTFQNRGGIDQFLASQGTSGQKLVAANRLINAETEVYRQRLVELGLLKPEQYIENYLPFMRYRAVRPGEIVVERLGDLQQVAEYYGGPPRVRAAILKARHLDDVPQRMQDLKLHEILDMQVKQVARAIATEEQLIRGGLGDAGKVLKPDGSMATNWLAQQAAKIQDPELAQRMDVLINDVLGTPRGMSMAQDPNWRHYLTLARRMQFYHLIGMNPLTAAVNLTQQLIPFSRVSMSAYGKAVKMLIQDTPITVEGATRSIPAREFAERFMGASGQYNQADRVLLNEGALGKVLDASEKMFRWSESSNQRITAMAGYLEGLARGKTQQEAIQMGRDLNRYANQFGAFNSPEVFRTPIGSVIGQFKPFQIGYWGIMKDFVDDARKGVVNVAGGNFHEGMQQVLPLVKYMTALGVLGGTATAVGEPGVDDNDTLMGQVRRELPALLEPVLGDFAKHGLLGLFGANLSNQIGIGAVPFANTRADLRDVLWFLPGPMASHVMDVASATTYIADSVGLNPHFTPNQDVKRGINLSLQNMGREIGPDEAASLMTRSFPLAGPQLDRLRKWVKAAQVGGAEVEAMNLLQAMGWELPSGTNLRPPPEPTAIERTLGLPQAVTNAKTLLVNPQKRQQEITSLQRTKELGHEYNMAMRTYQQYLAANMFEEAEAFRRQFEQRYGTPMLPSKGGYDQAIERRLYPAGERSLMGRPWPVEVHERMRQLE